MSDPKNQVLTDDARNSSNFYESDRILRHYLEQHVSDLAMEYMDSQLHYQGKQAAVAMDALSFAADKQSPELKKRNPQGEPADEVVFHPAYWELVDIAARSEMFYVKYDANLRQQFCRAASQNGVLPPDSFML
ncbi:MAG: hypothetical protein U5J95_02555 [Balneolaceae bacterium]|nr:hypothetical protein [Balneolaceae bacterium]